MHENETLLGDVIMQAVCAWEQATGLCWANVGGMGLENCRHEGRLAQLLGRAWSKQEGWAHTHAGRRSWVVRQGQAMGPGACKDDWSIGAGPTCLGPELLGLFGPSLRRAILGLQNKMKMVLTWALNWMMGLGPNNKKRKN